jgi:hypothetical protein
MPVALYGELSFSNEEGLDVRYMCSNPQTAQEFAKAWAAFRRSLSPGSGNTDIISGGESEHPFNGVEKAKQASKKLFAASSAFISSNRKFTAAFRSNMEDKPDGHGSTTTITTEDLTSYQAAVSDLIAAAKDVEQTFTFAPESPKRKYHRAVKNLEASWEAFLPSNDESINGDALVPFVNEAAAFLSVGKEFVDAIGLYLEPEIA